MAQVFENFTVDCHAFFEYGVNVNAIYHNSDNKIYMFDSRYYCYY